LNSSVQQERPRVKEKQIFLWAFWQSPKSSEAEVWRQSTQLLKARQRLEIFHFFSLK